MRHTFSRLLLAGVASLTLSSVAVSAAYAAPSSPVTTKISTDSRTCSVTGTVSWHMTSADSATIQIYNTNNLGVPVASNTNSTPKDNGKLSVTYDGVSGESYKAFGNIAGSPGGSVLSAAVTLTCKA